MEPRKRKRSEARKRVIDVDVEVKFHDLGDVRFRSFFGRKENVVLELAAMEDYLISREQSVPVDEAAETRPGSPSRPDGSVPIVMRSSFKYAVVSGGPDLHFTTSMHPEAGLKILLQSVVRLESCYVFTAAYLIGTRPILSPPGLINCYHLRCAPVSGEIDVPRLAESIAREEVSALGEERHGPHRPSMEGFENMAVELQREIRDGVGRLVHDFRERKITVEIDVRKALADDRFVHDAIRRLGEEVVSFLPPARGRRPTVDRRQLRAQYETVLTACKQLLSNAKSWPPTNSIPGAVMLAQQHFRLTTEQAAEVGGILRKGFRRPQAKRLAIRILSVVSGLSVRQLYELVVK